VRLVRVDVDQLGKLARGGRHIVGGAAVGGPEIETVRGRLERLGLEVESLERGRESGTEQGVDQTLQTWMFRFAADNPAPATIVLVGGDGAGWKDGRGFLADLQRLHGQGYGVEVLSWEQALNGHLRRWVSDEGRVISLDCHYYEVTFLNEGVRHARPVNLAARADGVAAEGKMRPSRSIRTNPRRSIPFSALG